MGKTLFGLRTPEEKKIYQEYYTHFYKNYLKTMNERESKYYADHYADFYATYFTSNAYKTAVSYALPKATPASLSYPTESAIAPLRISQKGLGIIKYFEGFKENPYLDAGGKMTIGYGHLLRRGEYYTEISKNEAVALLKDDIALAEAAVKRLVEVELTNNQFSALVSLVYNIGMGNFAKSTLLKKLNKSDYGGATKEFVRWRFVGKRALKGLKKRRLVEAALFKRMPKVTPVPKPEATGLIPQTILDNLNLIR